MLRFIRWYSQLPNKQLTLSKFDFPLATSTISSISSNLSKYLNQTHTKITLNGHLNRKPRIRPQLGFAFLRDCQGDEIQLLAIPGVTNDSIFKLMNDLVVEDSISVTGYVQSKVMLENQQDTPQWELVIEDFQILNGSNEVASKLDKLKHANPENLPPQFRYLQLRTKPYQQALRIRSKISQLIRNILIDHHDFVEIETPLLFKSTPEGAHEFLVPTRNYNSFYALPQSPQQYKQILMSSGFTKYFQIAKCFRDEDLRSDRQPEFTQIDLEMSFVNNSNQVMNVVEDLINNIWKSQDKPTYTVNKQGYLEKVNHETGVVQFTKLDYLTALTKYGIDKPDLRSNLTFTDISPYLTNQENSEFPVVEVCILRQPPGKPHIPKSLIEDISYKQRKPYVFSIKSEQAITSWYKKLIQAGIFTPTESFNEDSLNKLLNLQIGDILAVSTRSEFPYENPTPLGRFRQLAIQEFPNHWQRPIQEHDNLVEHYNLDNIIVGSWVVDFPLFNPIQISQDKKYPEYDYTQFESTHHPFTMAKLEDYDMLSSDPLKVRGEHYDLVVNGVEVGGGSRRIHDATLQTYIFKEILNIGNYQQLFGHLLKALSMGCPPHAGLALGFDRLCAMLIGSSSIRDVIAFPKNQSGVDPVVESPTGVDESVLKEYNISLAEPTEPTERSEVE
ncbi:Aspartate--tRNA ligase mitochondrial [Spathaspora sp. JA1]|nr:Aspartate--tRNA ligase mitochondrial [Spathaspora sp. JA1]